MISIFNICVISTHIINCRVATSRLPGLTPDLLDQCPNLCPQYCDVHVSARCAMNGRLDVPGVYIKLLRLPVQACTVWANSGSLTRSLLGYQPI